MLYCLLEIHDLACLVLNEGYIIKKTIDLVGKPCGSISIYIGMILSTLGLSSRGFVFGLFPQKALNQLDVIHAYILISVLIPN